MQGRGEEWTVWIRLLTGNCYTFLVAHAILIISILFTRLREVVPKLDADYKLSKYETLTMAQNYIIAMIELLEKGTVETALTFFTSNENNNCSKILNNNNSNNFISETWFANNLYLKTKNDRIKLNKIEFIYY